MVGKKECRRLGVNDVEEMAADEVAASVALMYVRWRKNRRADLPLGPLPGPIVCFLSSRVGRDPK